MKLDYYFQKQSYFQFLLIYVVRNANAYFIKHEKQVVLGNISYMRYDSHVAPPANLLNVFSHV